MKRIAHLIIAVASLFLEYGLFAQSAELSVLEKQAICTFVIDLQNGRKELVAAAIHYPMNRSYPLRPINNEKEFIEHYDEFVDTAFIESVKSSEWERIGWRGICCGSGILWGDIDDNGEFYVYSYWLTKKGQIVWKEAVEKQRQRLYQEIRLFEEPVLMFKTIKYTVRVDLMADNTYRYASWGQNHDISSKPDLILTDGVMNSEGSLHQEYYTFTNGEYEYEIRPGNCCGFDYEITVSKNGRVLLRQQGNLYY